jgi:pilus assembly protein CpaB
MTGRLKILAAALLVLGMLLVLVAMLSSPKNSPLEDKPAVVETTFPFLVAKNPIVFGEPISADMVAIERSNTKREDVFTDPNDVIGRIPVLSVQPGKTLTPDIFEPNAVSDQIRTGYRAVAIRIDDNLAGTGKLKPGDLVDVFSVFRRDDRDIGSTQSRQVLPRVRVITVGPKVVGQAVDKAKEKEAEAAQGSNPQRSVTVEVLVSDVNALLLAQQQGTLMLALRNPEDNAMPAREEFPEPATLLKKKDNKDKTKKEPATTSPEDKAYGGIGIASVVGGTMPTSATPANAAKAEGSKSSKPKEETPKTEMIRKGKATSEAAQ